MVNSFSHFILMRIGLGIGEAPFMPAGVKSITDWYAQKERGTALGILTHLPLSVRLLRLLLLY